MDSRNIKQAIETATALEHELLSLPERIQQLGEADLREYLHSKFADLHEAAKNHLAALKEFRQEVEDEETCGKELLEDQHLPPQW